jgi:hypothetical protein
MDLVEELPLEAFWRRADVQVELDVPWSRRRVRTGIVLLSAKVASRAGPWQVSIQLFRSRSRQFGRWKCLEACRQPENGPDQKYPGQCD